MGSVNERGGIPIEGERKGEEKERERGGEEEMPSKGQTIAKECVKPIMDEEGKRGGGLST